MKKITLSLMAVFFYCHTFSQVGIGTTSPDTSSILDVKSTSKGLLIPRVNLTSTTLDLDGVPGQETGLLVFNSGSTLTMGFYYWNGTEWRSVKNTTSNPPAINDIKCNTAILSPNSYSAGVPYNGYMTVTYNGGNGADYPSQSPINSTGVTGLTATLSGGTLSNGTGTFTYQITGTPSASSPNTADFLLPTTFGGTGCTATVGLGTTMAVGETKSFRVEVDATLFTTNAGTRTVMTDRGVGNTATTNRNSAWELSTPAVRANFPMINGLRMDFLESAINNGNVSPKFFNTTTLPITYNISALSTNDAIVNGLATTIAPNAYAWKIDGNDDMGVSLAPNYNTEYVNGMLTFASGEWYMVTYHATRDASKYYFYMTVQRLN